MMRRFKSVSIQSFLQIVLFLIATPPLSAQKHDADTARAAVRGMQVYMEVKDHLTHDPVKNVKAELLWAADSSHADTVHFEYQEEEYFKSSSLDFPITKAGDYLLKVDAEGYVSKYVPVEVKKLYKRENYRYLKPVYLRTIPKKLERELDEFVVVATKLKFYMDGDTLVYDADAFNMAEGSMLSELIRKLPGVELEKGGVIKVNGKQVDALLLNGKNFFDSDRELLLENMPSYMVKNIQSFERVPEEVKGTPREKNTKKELVLNVKLKKEYATGWIANAEGGAGATFFRNQEGKLDTKFMGRLFGLRFSDNTRITLFANVNNVNDNGQPGYEGEWSDLEQTDGLTTTYQVGGNFMRDKEDKYNYQGSVNGSYSDIDNASHTTSATFLEGGDTYGKSFQNSRNYAWGFQSSHDLRLQHTDPLWETFRYIFLSLRPNVSYNKWNNRGNNASVTLAEDVAAQLGKAWMDSIMTPNAGELLRRYAINRTMTTSKGNGHQTNANFDGFLTFMPAHNDYVNFDVQFGYNYSDSRTDSYEHYLLDYPNSATQPTDFRNRYNPSKQRSHQARAGAGVGIAFDKEQHHQLFFKHTFEYHHNTNNRSLYLLNKLDEWSKPETHSLGTLPSVDDMLSTLDAQNSSHSTTNNVSNQAYLSYSYSLMEGDNSTFFTLVLNAPFTHERLDYCRGTQVDTLLTRNTALFNPSISFSKDNYKKNKGVSINYTLNNSAPSMTSLLNIRDDSNPLYITLGNPNLKKTHSHDFSLYYHDKWKKTLFNSFLSANITENAVASGYIYNKETGVRTVTPDNVNGNWNLSANSNVSVALDKNDKWRVSQRVGYSHTNNVDLSGTNESLVATKSVVVSDNVNEYLSLRWQPSSKMEFGVAGNLNYQHSGSEREDFTTLDVFSFNYGLTTKVELPWGMQVSSDITMYSRRGYSESSMNTNELVWNARLSKRMMKGKLTLMFDGFDLLGNLSNVQRTVNAQGRAEVFRNVIPSYGILHVIYRLNRQPQKK